MKELLHFLFMSPAVAMELLLASLLINLLGLASSLYVMHVLNRYIGSGVDATLITLTVGVVIAIVTEWWLRQLRRDLALGMIEHPMGWLAAGFFNSVLGVRLAELLRVPAASQKELFDHFFMLLKTYTPITLLVLVDLPFVLLFVVAIFLIHPVLSLLVLLFLGAIFLVTLVHHARLANPTRELSRMMAQHGALSASMVTAAESVRAFNGAGMMREIWWEHHVKLHWEQSAMVDRQERLLTLTQGIGALMGVAVIGAGAKLATLGQMDAGLLIGANILASRALAPLLKFAQMVPQLARARQGLEMLVQFSRLPVEKSGGTVLSAFQGVMALQQIGFAWPGSKGPLFESLSVTLEPGKLVAILGGNGAGKTTLLRLLAGILEPQRGRILVDGYNLAQIADEWWHRQVSYVPQEPVFLETTLRRNLLTLRPGLDDAALHALVVRSGLQRFVQESEQGLDQILVEGGRRLAPGIRRRMALARALAADGQLVLLDEPLEGLDEEGRRFFLEWMQAVVLAGRTVVVATHDPGLARAARVVIDLHAKPVPVVTTMVSGQQEGV